MQLRLFFLKPEALFQQQNYLLWNSQTKSSKGCSIHDPNTLNENIFLQIALLKKILVIFLFQHFKLHCLNLPFLAHTHECTRHRFVQKFRSSDFGLDSRTNILHCCEGGRKNKYVTFSLNFIYQETKPGALVHIQLYTLHPKTVSTTLIKQRLNFSTLD